MQACEIIANPIRNFVSCLSEFSALLAESSITNLSSQKLALELGLDQIANALNTCRENKGTVYIIGNGGSAAIASHVVIDLLNMAKMKAMALLNSSVVTCISNDYGYEHVYAKQITQFASEKDILVAISSSGKSQNILNAVDAAKTCGSKVITLSGFSEQNPLRKSGDFNVWLNSHDYGQVEIGHAFLLHQLTDRLC